MPLQWDNTGRLVPPSKVEKVLDDSFMLGALPSWLTTGSGTASFGATASTRGYLQMTTGSSSGNQANVRCNFTLSLTSVAAIRWDAYGLILDSTSGVAGIAMGIAASGSVGMFIRQDPSIADPTLITFSAGSGVYQSYSLTVGDESQKRRNLSMLLLPPTRELYVMEDDQVMAYRQAAAMNLGAVAPDLTITTREAVAHNFQVSRLRLTVWHD